MSMAYETLRRDGSLPATWEVIHASSWGGERRERHDGEFPREAFIDPAAIRRRPR
jgi:hypothetical protein